MLLLRRKQIRAMLPAPHVEFAHPRLDRHRITARKTRQTKTFPRLPGRANHAVDAEITDPVRANIFTDLILRTLVCDQVFRIGEIDSVVTRESMRRATDAHVNFLRARLS